MSQGRQRGHPGKGPQQPSGARGPAAMTVTTGFTHEEEPTALPSELDSDLKSDEAGPGWGGSRGDVGARLSHGWVEQHVPECPLCYWRGSH